MHGLTDALIILAVVILNADLVFTKGQAEAAIEALKDMSVKLLMSVVMA